MACTLVHTVAFDRVVWYVFVRSKSGQNSHDATKYKLKTKLQNIHIKKTLKSKQFRCKNDVQLCTTWMNEKYSTK